MAMLLMRENPRWNSKSGDSGVEVNQQYRQDGAWILLLLCRIWVDVDDDARGSCFGNWHMNLLREEQTTLANPG
jgi:hypothetical protein